MFFCSYNKTFCMKENIIKKKDYLKRFGRTIFVLLAFPSLTDP